MSVQHLQRILFPAREALAAQNQRVKAEPYFIAYLGLMVPFSTGVAWAAGANWAVVGFTCTMFALFPALMWRASPGALKTRLTIGAGLVAQWILLIYAASGINNGQFVLDTHMIFFIFMGSLVWLLCPSTILFVFGIVGLHNFVFSFGLPALIWPAEAFALGHLATHVLFAVVTLASSLALTISFRSKLLSAEDAFAQSEAAKSAAEEGKAKADDARMAAAEAQHKAEDAARRSDALLAEQKRAQAQDAKRTAALQELLTDFDGVTAASQGDFKAHMRVNFDERDLKGIAERMNNLMTTIETNIGDVVINLNALAQGDLECEIVGTRCGAFGRMQTDFNSAILTLKTTMFRISDSSLAVASNASELEGASQIMSQQGENTACALEDASNAIEKITSSVKHVVLSTREANQATKLIQKKTSESRIVSDQTEASINRLTEASRKINSVVKVIEDIAFQISLLALNAGVEAARAGEAGRGFSVVASEVRALAQRSQDAVQEIGIVIEENNRTVQDGVSQVTKTRQTLEEIAGQVEEASQKISEISSTVEEQATAMEEVRTTVVTIDASAQKNAASLEELSASNTVLSQEAKAMNELVKTFKGLNSDSASGQVAA